MNPPHPLILYLSTTIFYCRVSNAKFFINNSFYTSSYTFPHIHNTSSYTLITHPVTHTTPHHTTTPHYPLLLLDLGKGTNAEVKLVQHCRTNQLFACKIVMRPNPTSRSKVMKIKTNTVKLTN